MTERGSRIRQGIFALSLVTGAVVFGEGYQDAHIISDKATTINVVTRSYLPTAIAALAPENVSELEIAGEMRNITSVPHPRPDSAEYWLQTAAGQFELGDLKRGQLLNIAHSIETAKYPPDDTYYSRDQEQTELVIQDLNNDLAALLTRGARETAQAIAGVLIPIVTLGLIRLWNKVEKRKRART